MNVAEFTDKLVLRFIKQYYWNIQSSSAISGEGLKEGLEWLRQIFQNN